MLLFLFSLSMLLFLFCEVSCKIYSVELFEHRVLKISLTGQRPLLVVWGTNFRFFFAILIELFGYKMNVSHEC